MGKNTQDFLVMSSMHLNQSNVLSHLHIYRKGHAGHVAPLGQIIRNQSQLLHTTTCLEEK
jgi:hypothetical protein